MQPAGDTERDGGHPYGARESGRWCNKEGSGPTQPSIHPLKSHFTQPASDSRYAPGLLMGRRWVGLLLLLSCCCSICISSGLPNFLLRLVTAVSCDDPTSAEEGYRSHRMIQIARRGESDTTARLAELVEEAWRRCCTKYGQMGWGVVANLRVSVRSMGAARTSFRQPLGTRN